MTASEQANAQQVEAARQAWFLHPYESYLYSLAAGVESWNQAILGADEPEALIEDWISHVLAGFLNREEAGFVGLVNSAPLRMYLISRAWKSGGETHLSAEVSGFRLDYAQKRALPRAVAKLMEGAQQAATQPGVATDWQLLLHLTDPSELHKMAAQPHRLTLRGYPYVHMFSAKLSAFSALEEISLSGSDATDEDLQNLSDCRQLISLDLTRTAVTSHGLQSLIGLPQLHTLVLTGTLVHDAALTHIADMANLEHVVLPKEFFSDLSVEQLRGQLPGCTVERA